MTHSVTKMKAAYIDNYVKSFDEIVVGELPKPSLRPGHALVKVKAAAGNPLDKIVRGFMRSMWDGPFPYTLGVDYAGIVESVGEGVNNFKPGDEIFGLNWGTTGMVDNVPDPIVGGCYSEYLLIPATKLSKKPANVSFEVAACIGVVGTTAYEGLIQTGKATAGSRVLILGGSTAVGAIAIQLGKIVGAHVTATASTRAFDFVKKFKPDKIVNYNESKWENDPELKNVDVILDTVGEKDGLPRAISSGVVKAGGAYVSIVDYSLGVNFSAYPPLRWGGFMGAKQNSNTQSEIAKLISEGKLTMPIDTVFPFTKEGVVAMLEKIAGGKSLGKQVLAIN